MSRYRRYPLLTSAVLVVSVALGACTATPPTSSPLPALPPPPMADASASSSPPAADPATTPPPPATDPSTTPPPSAGEPSAACDEGKGSWAVGRIADETMMSKLLNDTGAKRIRRLKPGMMVTMEFDGTRLNVRVDNNNKVLSVTCG